MNARILFYNDQTGEGKLITEEGQKYEFNVEHWNDFEHMPKSGLKVVCEIDKKGPVRIEADRQKPEKKAEEKKSEESEQKAIQKEKLKTEENDLKEKEQLLKELSRKNREPGSATISVEKCVSSYFEPVDFLIGDPPEIVNTRERLDYFRIRRFLNTAYNDLRNLDPSLHRNKELSERLVLIENLYKAYKNIQSKKDNPGLAFETIFLRSQPEYLRHIRYKEDCLTRISELNQIEESIYPEIREKEEILKKFKGSNAEKERLEGIMKKMKKMYVDSIHENANLSEEMTNMADLKALYVSKYYDEFVLEFSSKLEYYMTLIEKILSYKTYAFDKLMWKRAGKSRAVQEYFSESHIDGDYSTLTFLRYYLNTLDVTKLNEEQRDLFHLQVYLEEQSKQKKGT